MQLIVLEQSKMQKLQKTIKDIVKKLHTGKIKPNTADLFSSNKYNGQGYYVKIKDPKIHDSQIVIDITRISETKYVASVAIDKMQGRFIFTIN